MTVENPTNAEQQISPSESEKKADEGQFYVTFIDNNQVSIQTPSGHRICFEFGAMVSTKEHDLFVEQMQNPNQPLPSIESLKLGIVRTAEGFLEDRPKRGGSNDLSTTYTWENHAQEHEVSVEEMKKMYFFARESLYNRFKTRLRDNKSNHD